MCKIIDIQPVIHKSNVRRIANNVLVSMGASPQGRNLSDFVPCSLSEVNNLFLVVYIINRFFPSPSLTKVQYPTVVEDLVIEVLVRESLIKQRVLAGSNLGYLSLYTD